MVVGQEDGREAEGEATEGLGVEETGGVGGVQEARWGVRWPYSRLPVCVRCWHCHRSLWGISSRHSSRVEVEELEGVEGNNAGVGDSDRGEGSLSAGKEGRDEPLASHYRCLIVEFH